jgi:O-methyltransferase
VLCGWLMTTQKRLASSAAGILLHSCCIHNHKKCLRGVIVKRSQLRDTLNLALDFTGQRLVSCASLQNEAQRQGALSDALAGAYAQYVFPTLPAREGRTELLKRLLGTPIPEAMYLLSLLHEALPRGGDVCEFGVAQGATSALIANEILDSAASFWMYDSFQGLSAPSTQDSLLDDVFGLGSMAKYRNAMAFPRSILENRLNEIALPAGRKHIIEGYIRSDLPETSLPGVVSFAYLDFDLYEPILTALHMLHPKTRQGSILMVDDFKFFSSGAETAVLEFLQSHPDEYTLHEPPAIAGKFCWLVRR